MDKWITIQEAMEILNVSRQHVYTLAERYKWRTAKRGSTRFYHHDDVKNTPSANERQRQGYEQRGLNHDAND